MNGSVVDAQFRLRDQCDRLVDRLRSLSTVRLARSGVAEPSVAESAYALAQVLADLAADLEQRPIREVPRLNDLAVGDQVAVTAHDLLAASEVAVEGNGIPDPAVALNVALVAVEALRSRL